MQLRRSRPEDEPGTKAPKHSTAPSEETARYPRPKILVVDAPEVCEALQQNGYAATQGTFGQPLTIEKGMGYISPPSSMDLPGHTEQEIIIVDLAGPEPIPFETSSYEQPAPGVMAMWAPTADGLIDPRPLGMLNVRKDMDRIYRHGGVFILFASKRSGWGFALTYRRPTGDLEHVDARRFNADNWNLLSDLQWLTIVNDVGQEMLVAANGAAKKLGIDGFMSRGYFDCTIRPSGVAKQWITLAVSKYDDPVGGVIFPSQGAEEQATGLIFIFPQIERRSELVIDLMSHVLPELTPRLFPHAEGSLWTRRPEYDLPVVAQLKNEIAETEETMRLRLRELEEKIEAQRSANRYLDDLLTATGKDLVAAVARALDVLGFSDVRDADADILASGDTKQLREDLRIMDAPVPVLVEVKGIAGIPKEASALQVAKYLTPRMREWKRYDLHGLAIVNHQRNLPALDRDHEHVFQTDVIANAEEQGFGLLTTWDLFRLVRGYVIHRWQHEDVAELFVTKGRVMPIPRRYSFIGVIDGFWPKVSSLGIRLSSGMLRVGDRVAYELPVDFVEEGIVSMQVDNQHIEAANAGDHIAIQTMLTKLQARDNVRVYRVADKAECGGS